MSEMLYHHGIMTTGVEEFTGHHTALTGHGEDIKGHQATLHGAQEGTGSEQYQAWQNKWNGGHGEVVDATHQLIQALNGSLERAVHTDNKVAGSWDA